MLSQTLHRQNAATLIRVLAILSFACLTAIAARLSVWLPHSPVPLTMQVMVVILSGLVLGPRDALLAQTVYLQMILLGAPVTASGLGGPLVLAGPTAGYLWSFPLAALVAGGISQRSTLHRSVTRTLGGLAALCIIYGMGMSWLSGFVGGWENAWLVGVLPFVTADLLKVLIVSVVPSLWSR